MSRALVIGGRRGIGAAVVRELTERGFEVTYTYRTEPGTFPSDGGGLRLDLADREEVEAFRETLEDGANLGRAGAGRRHDL